MSTQQKTITREELYAAVWSKTLKALAIEWNTTYLHLVRACDVMEVPRPSPSYWPSLALGYMVEKEPLNACTEDTPNEWVLLPPSIREKKSPSKKNCSRQPSGDDHIATRQNRQHRFPTHRSKADFREKVEL
jgi:hypothetical protein